jgi:hypothetical protein
MIEYKIAKEIDKYCNDKNQINILNLGAGKSIPLYVPTNIYYEIVNIDNNYYEIDNSQYVKKIFDNKYPQNRIFYIKSDCNEFMERTYISYDMVILYRYLEHVPFTEIEYFIYLISRSIKMGGYVDVIVPNYKILANMIINDDDAYLSNYINGLNKTFHNYNIELTTELLNEKYDPHLSIWTPKRIKYFWELEKRFELIDIQEEYLYDQRNVYLRALLKRV